MTERHTPVSDTSPAAERVQVELLRRATVEQHYAATRALSEMAMWHAWQTIERNNPDADRAELLRRYVARYYGDDLAGRLAAWLQARRPA